MIFQNIEILAASNILSHSRQPLPCVCIKAQFKGKNSPEVQVIHRVMQRREAGGVQWWRECFTFPLCSFPLQSLPFLSINSFCISSDQTFCPPSLGSQCQRIYWSQVEARTIENGKWEDTFCISSVLRPGKAQTTATVRKAVLLDWLPRLFHLFTPRCPVGEDTDAQRPLASAAAIVRRKKCKDRQHWGFLNWSWLPLKYTHPHIHIHTRILTHSFTQSSLN